VVVADYSREPGTTRVESLAHDPRSGLFFLGTGSAVHAVDAAGREHWSVPHANEQWGEPMWCDDALYTYDTKTKQVFKYVTAGTAAPTRAWSCDIGSVYAELAKGVDGAGDALVFVSGWKLGRPGTLTAVHDAGPSAGKPKWGPIKLAHPLKHCSVRVGHDELLLPAHNGFVEVRQASTGELKRRFPIVDASAGSTPWSQVVISEPYAIVTTHDGSAPGNYLYVFDIASGREVWRSAAFNGGVGCMIPVVSAGIGVVGTYGEGTWHAFRIGDGSPFPFSRFAGPSHDGQAAGALKRVRTAAP
jgi:outer membrane protein assembly factor BamB